MSTLWNIRKATWSRAAWLTSPATGPGLSWGKACRATARFPPWRRQQKKSPKPGPGRRICHRSVPCCSRVGRRVTPPPVRSRAVSSLGKSVASASRAWIQHQRRLSSNWPKFMVAFFSILAIGFFLGMRHATDPDHVIAVTTILSRQRRLGRAALTGAFWGVGHTLTIFVVGAMIILFNIVIPIRLGLSMEFSVALMLIVLGIMNVAAFMRSASAISAEANDAVHVHPHAHGDYIHTHAHGHSPETHSHSSGSTPLALLDRLFGKL